MFLYVIDQDNSQTILPVVMQYGEALQQGKTLCEKTSTSLSSAFTHLGGSQVAVEYAAVVKVLQTGSNL